MQEKEKNEIPSNQSQVETSGNQEEGGEAQILNSATLPEKNDSETSATATLPEGLDEEMQYSPEEYEEMKRIYDQTLSKFVEGEIVKGKILSIDEREVSVDIGFKSEGIVPVEEFSNLEEFKPGDEIEVYLDSVEDKDGQLVLSRKKADFMRAWEKVVEKYRKDETIEGRIVRRIKGGMVVDLMGVEAFLPGSQIDIKPVRDFDVLVGQTMTFKIVNVNELRKNIVVSRRVLLEEAMKDQREKILNELHRDQVLEGTVKNITDFGVFIDLGGVDGLLHINDLSWGRVSHPSEVVSLDQKIKVKVLDFDENKTRISLGLKQLLPHPWEDVEKKYQVGSKVKGKVVNITDYGAFIELEKGIEGLIHISEMSWTQHVKHPSQVLSLGDLVEAVVLSVDKEEHKISLGLKQLQPDPWENIEEKYPVGSHHKGVVRNLTNFGAFVELEEGIDGLVHISDLSWTRKVRHPNEILKKNETIEVVILGIDRENRRISLGHKQVFENPWDVLENAYKVGTHVTGKVVRAIEKGVIVEIPTNVEGFVPISHLSRMRKASHRRTSEFYKPGDVLELTVIEFDKDNKRIVLSEKPVEELNIEAEAEKVGEETPKEFEVTEPGMEAEEAKPENVETAEVESEKVPSTEVKIETTAAETKQEEKKEEYEDKQVEAPSESVEKKKPRTRKRKTKTAAEETQSQTAEEEKSESSQKEG
ncbi:30S ribosomal protein S1 [bacterium]|nr:30S ribosomal protein S1 [bacterium]